jgi:hypothetical protein
MVEYIRVRVKIKAYMSVGLVVATTVSIKGWKLEKSSFYKRKELYKFYKSEKRVEIQTDTSP